MGRVRGADLDHAVRAPSPPGRNRFAAGEIGLWRWALALVVYALLLGFHAPLIGISPFPV